MSPMFRHVTLALESLRAVMRASLHVATTAVVLANGHAAVVAVGRRRWSLDLSPPSFRAVRLGRQFNAVQDVPPHT